MKTNQSEQRRLQMEQIQPEIPDNFEDLKHRYLELFQQLQETLLAKEKAESAIAAKSEFLANLSHDLRTPLHAILSYSRFGIDKISRIDTEKIIKYFKNIEESGKKLQEMLNKIVDLSKLESGKLMFKKYSSNLSLLTQSLVKENVEALEAKQIDVEIEAPETIGTVSCDQNRIAQVFNTLFQNAIQHAPEKTLIRITMKSEHSSQAGEPPLLKTCFYDQRVEPAPQLAVDDFDAFIGKERLKTGVGIDGVSLAIAYEITNYHHGRIQMQNQAGGGVIQSIVLPMETENQE